MRSISDLREKTNDYFGDCEYIPMDELIDQDIAILDAVTFENRDGLPTAAMKIARMDAQGNITDDVYKTTTHAGPIVDMLKSAQVIDLLAWVPPNLFSVEKHFSILPSGRRREPRPEPSPNCFYINGDESHGLRR